MTIGIALARRSSVRDGRNPVRRESPISKRWPMKLCGSGSIRAEAVAIRTKAASFDVARLYYCVSTRRNHPITGETRKNYS